MNPRDVVQGPMVTEKGTLLGEVANQVVFRVHPRANKIEIKSGGLLVGDVKAARVLIADGATFKGNINQ